MASSCPYNRPPNNNNNNGTFTNHVNYPYFVIVMTNYPELIQRTQHYQVPNQHWYQRPPAAMLIPDIMIHFGTSHSDEHERLLYNTMKYQIQQSIRAYLQRTRRRYPIYFIFDMSDLRTFM